MSETEIREWIERVTGEWGIKNLVCILTDEKSGHYAYARGGSAMSDETSAFIRALDTYHRDTEYFTILTTAERGASPATSRALVDFLREWGGLARNLPGEGKRRESLERALTDWMRQKHMILDELRSLAIQSVDFNEIGDCLAGLFDSLMGLEKGFGSTATGKTLHVLLPSLCVLWDGKYVRDTQGFDEDGQGYVEYLRSRQVILRDAFLCEARYGPNARLMAFLGPSEEPRGRKSCRGRDLGMSLEDFF